MNPLYIKLGVAAAIGFAVVLLYRHTQTAAATIPADQGLPATPVSGDASSGGAAGDTGGLPLPYLPGFTGGSIQGQQSDYAGYTATVGESVVPVPGVNYSDPYSVAAAVQAGVLPSSALLTGAGGAGGAYSQSVAAQQAAIAAQTAGAGATSGNVIAAGHSVAA